MQDDFRAAAIAKEPVLEAVDDPHRLARLFRSKHLRDDVPTLWYWREEWHRWRRGAYRVVPDKELRGELSECIKANFDARRR